MARHLGRAGIQARTCIVVQVSWTRRATADLVAIVVYIAQFNPTAARNTGRLLKETAESLADNPERGRSAERGLREIAAVRPYLIRYRVTESAVWITRIRHSARRPL